MTLNENAERALLDRVLEGKDTDFQAKVLDIVTRLGVRPHDPTFLIMIAVGQLQVLLERSPKDLSALFNQWSDALYDKIEAARRTAVKGQEKEIAAAMRSLIQKEQALQAKGLFTAILPASGVLMAAIGFGVFVGLMVPVWFQGGYSSQMPRKLTVKEAEILRWGMSSEGQLARNIMAWNSNLENLNCLDEAVRLPVILEVQGQAKSGWCPLWVVPFQERKPLSKKGGS